MAAKSTYKKNGFKKKPAVRITWEVNKVCIGYQVKRREVGSGTYAVVKTITGGKAASYLDASVKKGISYEYCVCAYVEGVRGEMVIGGPGEPAEVTVSQKMITPQISTRKRGERITIIFREAEGSSLQVQCRYAGSRKWTKVNGGNRSLKRKVDIYIRRKGRLQIRVRTSAKVNGRMAYSRWSRVVYFT